MLDFEPAYLALFRTGELSRRVNDAHKLLTECDVCAHECGHNRLSGERGLCNSGEAATVCSYHPHFGEERPLVGSRGSGTIFFSHCNLHCVFCQNYEISQMGDGHEVDDNELAGMMLQLQSLGCHNINLVSPSHVVPQILAGLLIAVDAGLKLPLVYNTGGYDSLETLRILDGIVDIYMPDMKCADEAVAEECMGVRNYPRVNCSAVKSMHRQVGDLQLDNQGTAIRGLIVRHLVLPDNLAGTAELAQFLANEVSTATYLNVMDQYRPCHQAGAHPPLDRPITADEHQKALQSCRDAGLRNVEAWH